MTNEKIVILGDIGTKPGSMKKIVLSCLWGVGMFFLSLSLFASPRPEEVLERLVERVVPDLRHKIVFRVDSTRKSDFFRISKMEGSPACTVLIEGDSPVSAASGLNWYLKYYCGSSLSFCGDRIAVPDSLPLPRTPVEIDAPHRHSFYMNYCTFGYSTAYWDWERWEREIDLMALNGVTTPMAMVGAEAVWRNTLRRFGYSDDEIGRFLPGPPFLAWFLMGNLEGQGGPLPDEWFGRQEALQKKIVARMREYGMKPVFQGFFGMVPSDLKDKYPDAHLISQGRWNGLMRPPVLDPSDPLFDRMAAVWYEEYEKLFGKADYFGGDLFHEGGLTGGLDVAMAAGRVQRAMRTANPDAVWMIQAWGENPKESLLKGLDPSHTIVVDICAEYWSRWQERGAFGGFPWIWAHLTNYGGNVGLHGRLQAIAEGPVRGLKDLAAGHWMAGVGTAPEGIEVNPVAFELGFEMRWRDTVPDVERWISDYARRRYGSSSEVVDSAWWIFLRTAYGTYDGSRRPSESVFCAQPSLKGQNITASAWSQCKIYYDPALFARGVALFLQAAPELKDCATYCYDAVDFVRQYLADQGREAYYGLTEAFRSGDRQRFDSLSGRFLGLIADQDSLLTAHPGFHVAHWLEQARAASDDPRIQDLYEYNARLLIGTWTPFRSSVRDYAHKEWGGMLRDYYLPRWKGYLDYLARHWNDRNTVLLREGRSVLRQGDGEGRVHGTPALPVKPVALPPDDRPDSFPQETEWVRANNRYVPDTTGNPVDRAVALFAKYGPQQ